MHSAELEAAYRATDYRVDGSSGPFVIHIGSICQPLEHLLGENAVSSWAYITACNPKSRQLSIAANAERMRQLEAAISAAGFQFLRGAGAGSAGDWPPEPSILILGIDEHAALEVAKQFEQHAIVCSQKGEPARIVWTIT
jgi:hypothetical protein